MSVDLQAKQIEPLRNTFGHVAKYVKGNKPASRYEEATYGAQPTTNFHYRPTWDPAHELFDASRSQVVLEDWYVLRDPRQFYYGTWTMARAKQQDAVDSSFKFVESRGLLDKMSDELTQLTCDVLMPLRHVAWGGNMNNCNIGAIGYGTAFTAPAMFHAMDQLGVAQYITRLGLALGETAVLDKGKQDWLDQPQWQVLRRYVEDTLVIQDPFELFVAQNYALDGLLYPLIFETFVEARLTLEGGAAVAMVTSFMNDWFNESARWINAVIKVAANESEANNHLISGWSKQWSDRAEQALAPIAAIALQGQAQASLDDARAELDARSIKNGLGHK
jgi:phenol hydroxylase P1 protein